MKLAFKDIKGKTKLKLDSKLTIEDLAKLKIKISLKDKNATQNIDELVHRPKL